MDPLPPLPSGREGGGQTRPVPPGPKARLPRGGDTASEAGPAATRLSSEALLPTHPRPSLTVHPSQDTKTPRRLPATDRALQETSAQQPREGDHTVPDLSKGRGWEAGRQLCGHPRPSLTKDSKRSPRPGLGAGEEQDGCVGGRLGPEKHGVGARLRRGGVGGGEAGLLAEEKTPPQLLLGAPTARLGHHEERPPQPGAGHERQVAQHRL